MSRAAACLLSGALLAWGCGNPASSAATPDDAGKDAASEAAPPVEAGARIRTVEVRNPFGETAEHNLMVDGDFELTSSTGQFGWRASNAGNEATLVRETGGLCRSGLTCGKIDPGLDLLGFAAAPRDKSFEISLYTKPPLADCSTTVVSLINCSGIFASTIATVPPTTDVPDDRGWCHHYAISPPIDFRPCIYVVSYGDAGTTTLVDQASLLAADGSGPGSLASGPPSPEFHARVTRALRSLHERTRFGRAEPSRP